MKEINQKIGFLKGLLESGEIDLNTASGRFAAATAEVLRMMAARVEDLDDLMADLNDYVESIDDDLIALEDNGSMSVADGDAFADMLAEAEMAPMEMVDEEAAITEMPVPAACPECHGVFKVAGTSVFGKTATCPFCEKHIELMPFSLSSLKMVKPDK